MYGVHPRLFVGSIEDCIKQDNDWCVIHACKHPCHQRALGYKGSLRPGHPYYLIYEKGNHLYLNMVDWAKGVPDHEYYGPIYNKAMEFVDKHIKLSKVLIHCNLGASRAVSMAMLYMARIEILPRDYKEAKKIFRELYAGEMDISRGLDSYLEANWERLIDGT